MSLPYTVRPRSDRTWLRPDGERVRSRFSSSWSNTLADLEHEITALDGRDVVIGCDVTEADLRLDGTLRARARAFTPAVEIAFDSRHGPMLYRCDQYVAAWHDQGPDWQQNVRAIVLTLTALRAVDRYGASSSGERYTGYRQITADPATPPQATTKAAAREALLAVAGLPADNDITAHTLVRRARRAAHPDTGGSTTQWLAVQAAIDTLTKVGGDEA